MMELDLKEMIESVDIVEYISQFVDLQEKNGEFWGLSPFSDEKTPSFSVRKESNSFYCFSSGIGGNVFTFIKFYNKCSSQRAVEILKKYCGVDGKSFTPIKKMATTLVCKKYKKIIGRRKESKHKTYPPDCMSKYVKDRSKLKVWKDEGISDEALERFEVYYDGFSNRLVYPIRNLNGDIVNIGGRTLDPNFKEKGIRKYTYFSGWGEMDVLYGLFENMKDILEKKEVIIFEGCKSVLVANTWGIKNTAAILTSHLNPAQMKILARLGVRVVFALDKEVEIWKDHNISKLKKYINIEFLFDRFDLLDEKDAPVDKGEEVFRRLYDSRLSLQ